MFFAPFMDVQKAIARGSIGDLNPLPWVFMLGNCTGWTLYSILNPVRSDVLSCTGRKYFFALERICFWRTVLEMSRLYVLLF